MPYTFHVRLLRPTLLICAAVLGCRHQTPEPLLPLEMLKGVTALVSHPDVVLHDGTLCSSQGYAIHESIERVVAKVRAQLPPELGLVSDGIHIDKQFNPGQAGANFTGGHSGVTRVLDIRSGKPREGAPDDRSHEDQWSSLAIFRFHKG